MRRRRRQRLPGRVLQHRAAADDAVAVQRQRGSQVRTQSAVVLVPAPAKQFIASMATVPMHWPSVVPTRSSYSCWRTPRFTMQTASSYQRMPMATHMTRTVRRVSQYLRMQAGATGRGSGRTAAADRAAAGDVSGPGQARRQSAGAGGILRPQPRHRRRDRHRVSQVQGPRQVRLSLFMVLVCP